MDIYKLYNIGLFDSCIIKYVFIIELFNVIFIIFKIIIL